jgi:hypothetical protein
MNIKYNRGEVYIRMPNEVFVRLKKGVTIFLFAVGVGITAPTYGHEGIAPPVLNEVQLGASDIEISLAVNDISKISSGIYQTEENLFSSLQEHRADMMTQPDLEEFWTVSKEVTFLDFTDSMVCFEPDDRQITYDILDKSGLVLHLTQYLDNPKDQVVYSIEKNGRFLLAGHTQIKGMGVYLQQAINELLKEKG